MRIIKNPDDLKRPSDLLGKACQTAEWLTDNEIATADGIRWKQCPESDADVDDQPLLSEKCFYGGSSGTAFFLLRLYLVSKEERWLDKAAKAADHILATYKKDDFSAGAGSFLGVPTGFYNGTAGQAYFIENLYQVLKKNAAGKYADAGKYHEFALRTADDITQAQRTTGEGRSGTWTDTVSIIADGSIDLFLLYMYEVTGNEKYLIAAKRSGYYFIEKAEKTAAGHRWYAMDTFAFGLGERGYFPNFLYGASGNSYLLAVLYKLTGEDIFLEYAKSGAAYVESTAIESGKGVLVPYNDPCRTELFYLGMCQGPVGTSRLFKLLYELTGNEHYKDYVAKLTEGILSTGAPLVHSDGYWHTYCYCCGAAGMLEHFISAGKFLGTKNYASWAQAAADVLIGDSVETDGKRRWYTAWTRLIPKEVEPYTGLYHGSSGCASALLTLYNETHEKIELPGYLEDFWVNR